MTLGYRDLGLLSGLLLVSFGCIPATGQATIRTTQPQVNVVGRVVDSAGNPIAGVTATLAGDSVPMRSIRTDRSGWVRYAAVTPGLYLLTLHSPDYAKAVVTLDVHAGDQVSHTWTLAAGGRGAWACQAYVGQAFYVTVRDSVSGKDLTPTANAYALLNSDSMPLRPIPSHPDRQTERLDGPNEQAGHYTVVITHPGYVPWRHTLLVVSGQCHVQTRSIQALLVPSRPE
jgi:hypothetical protein